jgi:hypothetical protein
MPDFLHILAQRDDETPLSKIIFGLIFVFLWLVSWAASAIAKKKEQERRRRVRDALTRGEGAPPPLPQVPPTQMQIPLPPMQRMPPQHQRQEMPAPMQPPRRQHPPMRTVPPRRILTRPIPPARVQQPAPRRPAPPKQQRPSLVPTPTPPIPVSREPVPVKAHASVDATEISSSPPAATAGTGARRPSSPSAAALNAWLRPSTLRQQFILTEVLHPPVALRG